MTIRRFAMVYGIVFLLIGIAGFMPAFLQPFEPDAPDLGITAGAGRLFGLFPVNMLHDIIHIAFGIWGLVAYRTVSASVTYARSVAVIYAVFAVMGLFPVLMTTFGMVPLWGHDVWLHLVLAAIAAYFGYFAAREESPAAASRA